MKFCPVLYNDGGCFFHFDKNVALNKTCLGRGCGLSTTKVQNPVQNYSIQSYEYFGVLLLFGACPLCRYMQHPFDIV